MISPLGHVLVVDDDAGIRHLISAILARDGWSYEVADDGCDAIAKIERNHPDVILLDLMMPKVNGFEILDRLRVSKPELLRRVIVLTAASNSTLQRMTSEAEVFKLIRKPFELDELRAEVHRCAGSIHSERAAVVGREARISQP